MPTGESLTGTPSTPPGSAIRLPRAPSHCLIHPRSISTQPARPNTRASSLGERSLLGLHQNGCGFLVVLTIESPCLAQQAAGSQPLSIASQADSESIMVSYGRLGGGCRETRCWQPKSLRAWAPPAPHACFFSLGLLPSQ